MAYTKKTVFIADMTNAAKIKGDELLISVMNTKIQDMITRGVYDGNVELVFSTDGSGNPTAVTTRKWDSLALAEEWKTYAVEKNAAAGISWISFDILDI